MPETDDVSDSITDKLIAQVNKAVGHDCMIKASDLPDRGVRHTGSFKLDVALGGGYPQRGICEIYGAPGSYKTTMGYHALAACQREGQVAALLDVEQRANQQADLRRMCGVDDDKLVIVTLEWAEQYMVAARELIRQKVGVILLDSVGALTSKYWDTHEQDEDEKKVSGTGKVADLAKIVNQFVRIVTSAYAPEKASDPSTYPDTTLIFLNHLYQGFTTWGKSFDYIVGGKGKEFMALVRIKFQIGEPMVDVTDGKKTIIGDQVKFNVVKNSVCPKEEGIMSLLHCHTEDNDSVITVDNQNDLFNQAAYYKFFDASGKTWTFVGVNGEVIDLKGKEPSAKQFVDDNMSFILQQVFARARMERTGFMPYTFDVPEAVTVKGERVSLRVPGMQGKGREEGEALPEV